MTYVDTDHTFQKVPYTGSKNLTFIGGPVADNGIITVAGSVKIGTRQARERCAHFLKSK